LKQCLVGAVTHRCPLAGELTAANIVGAQLTFTTGNCGDKDTKLLIKEHITCLLCTGNIYRINRIFLYLWIEDRPWKILREA
jgi:hypothetical protein